MLLLIWDVETTGLKATSLVIEVACGLFDTEKRIFTSPILSTLLPAPKNEAAVFNKISEEELIELSNNPEALNHVRSVLSQMELMFGEAEASCAHNASFDRDKLAILCGDGPEGSGPRFGYFWGIDVKSKPWVCSCRDVTYGSPVADRKLETIAKALSVNTSGNHRAARDVMIVGEILASAPCLSDELGDLFATEKVKLKALVNMRNPPIDLLAQFGFSRSGSGEKGGFYRQMRESSLEQRIFPFTIQRSDTQEFRYAGKKDWLPKESFDEDLKLYVARDDKTVEIDLDPSYVRAGFLPVESSHLKAYKYSAHEDGGSFHVISKNGMHRKYVNVSQDQYLEFREELAKGLSAGSYIARRICGKYRFYFESEIPSPNFKSISMIELTSSKKYFCLWIDGIHVKLLSSNLDYVVTLVCADENDAHSTGVACLTAPMIHEMLKERFGAEYDYDVGRGGMAISIVSAA
ncbi:MAG: hypothetical protein EOO23_02105 [Comamonadaceae bacterium]|nr:MAG: hypothetical protein EOO23_02105 [Comamonadaceae bacterium]